MNADERLEVLGRIATTSERDVRADAITDGMRLKDDLDLGSLDAIMLMLDLEELYDVDVDDEELRSLVTVADVLALIDAKRASIAEPT